MSDNDWKSRLGMVYSTNPDFHYNQEDDSDLEPEIDPKDQKLIISIDRRNRGGKQVSIIKGFRGRESSLIELSKTLKNKLGTGGSAKDGEIIIQGDFRDKIIEVLNNLGYTKSKRGN
jgi:translation initiation factor 1